MKQSGRWRKKEKRGKAKTKQNKTKHYKVTVEF
jgi:hypothetical protein